MIALDSADKPRYDGGGGFMQQRRLKRGATNNITLR
jgi:hypothetical protein